jgi:hypothetical protein
VKFEVAILNAEVRKWTEVGERDPRFNDDWADRHCIAVEVVNESHARAKIERLRPRAEEFLAGNIVRINLG